MSALEHRSTDDSSLFLASRALSFTVALDPFSPLLASFSRSDCDLLRTFNRTMPALPEKGRPFRRDKFWATRKMVRTASNDSQYVSFRFVVTRAAGIASFVVCDNNFYDVHWLSGDRWRYYGPRHGETPPRRARIREDLS